MGIVIKQTNDLYQVTDTTDGGHVTRDSRYTCDWKSIWSSDFKLLEFYLNNFESTKLLDDKEDFDFHRARRAKARHLKGLKEFLGLIEEQKPKEKESILYYEGNGNLFPYIQKRDVLIHDKTIDLGRYSVKKFNLKYVKTTEENSLLAEEFNQKLNEFNEYKKQLFIKLFGE